MSDGSREDPTNKHSALLRLVGAGYRATDETTHQRVTVFATMTAVALPTFALLSLTELARGLIFDGVIDLGVAALLGASLALLRRGRLIEPLLRLTTTLIGVAMLYSAIQPDMTTGRHLWLLLFPIPAGLLVGWRLGAALSLCLGAATCGLLAFEESAPTGFVIRLGVTMGVATLIGVAFESIRARYQALAVAERARQRALIRALEASQRAAPDGSVSVCAGCRKIRVDGEWVALERFLEAQGLGRASHGLCSPCIARLYPDIAVTLTPMPD